MTATLLEVRDLDVYKGPRQLLTRFNLTVTTGSLLQLAGGNGVARRHYFELLLDWPELEY